MTLELFRTINSYLPLLAFGWLSYRTVKDWPAIWARPNHVWHYRFLLVIVNVYVVLTTLGTWAIEAKGAPPTWATPLFTMQTFLVLWVCWRWPPYRKKTP